MKSKNEREPCMPSPTISPSPSDAVTVAERGREIADLLVQGLQAGVRAEQETERRLERASREIRKPRRAARKKRLPVVEA